MKTKTILIMSAALFLSACSSGEKTAVEESVDVETSSTTPKVKTINVENPITAQTSDGVKIYGDAHFAELPPTSPLILLFHQGGSNGRAEYGPLVPWLNENGFRVIAWDQRSGGELYGESNRTKAGVTEDIPQGYCDAYPDLEAALNTTIDGEYADKVFIWGSSYSGALVFQLAAKNPDKVQGVIAFSPASGGPLAECLATKWVDQVKAPMLAFSPQSEIVREKTKNQKATLEEYGASYFITEKGIHGSSMLVDERTENDMSEARAHVIKWLKEQP